MQRERIEWGSILRKNSMPIDLPRFRDQIQGRSGQRRHVQRLANVAGSVWPAGVLVNENAATGEIQKRHAAQYG